MASKLTIEDRIELILMYARQDSSHGGVAAEFNRIIYIYIYSKSSLFARVAFLENLMISETVLNKTYFPIETNVLKGGCVFGSEFFGHKHKFLDINTNKQNTLLE